MANFLRDFQIKNIDVNEETLQKINQFLIAQKDKMQAEQLFLVYIIRFDGKGYRFFSFDEMLLHFRDGIDIERIILTLENETSLKSSRMSGTCLELKLDKLNPNNCTLLLTADDASWVDASFHSIQELLCKYKNRNGWVRTAWIEFAVQVFGIVLGFIISLWVAIKISPTLKVENPFLISFLFILLIFSNIWPYLNRKVIFFINNSFPNLKFYRQEKDKMHWVYRNIIGGIALAITLWFISQLSSFVSSIVNNLM